MSVATTSNEASNQLTGAVMHSCAYQQTVRVAIGRALYAALVFDRIYGMEFIFKYH